MLLKIALRITFSRIKMNKLNIQVFKQYLLNLSIIY